MAEELDILGIGALAVDDILRVARYPEPDQKQPVLGEERVLGGLAGTALAAASRLGARCAYLGVLGNDELSAAALAGLRRAGVNTSLVMIRPDARPVHSVIVADETAHTRNIFFNESRAVGPSLSDITAGLLGRAKVLFVDHVNIEAAIAACRLARQVGLASVADVEGQDTAGNRELMSLADHLIVSQSFARLLTGRQAPAEMIEQLAPAPRRACTAVTCGPAGCHYLPADGAEVSHQPAPGIAPQDTTGCGDVFHGAYAFGLARDWPVARCIRFASAAAAVFASRPAGWDHLPHEAEVRALLDSAG